jgi:hypothetical protein
LNQKVEDREARIRDLEKELAKPKELVMELSVRR